MRCPLCLSTYAIELTVYGDALKTFLCSTCRHQWRASIATELEVAPPSEIPKDIVAEPILAWRIWNVVIPTAVSLDQTKIDKMQREMREGYDPFSGLLSPTLRGVGVAQDWDGPTHHATCEARADPLMFGPPSIYHEVDPHPHVPAEKCSCGIWALKDEATMLQQLANYNRGAVMAYGQVQLWGRIFEHAKGYRGEYASPVSISVFGADAEVAEQLATKYKCEAKVGVPDLPERHVDITSFVGGISIGSSSYGPMQVTGGTITFAGAVGSSPITKIQNAFISPVGYSAMWGGTTNVSALGALTQAVDEEFPTLWDKLKHPWNKGPLKWMYDPLYVNPNSLIVRACSKVGLPIRRMTILLAPVTLPLYYLKRALTR